MARIRIVESHGNLLIERLSQLMHSKLIYVIITLIVAVNGPGDLLYNFL